MLNCNFRLLLQILQRKEVGIDYLFFSCSRLNENDKHWEKKHHFKHQALSHGKEAEIIDV